LNKKSTKEITFPVRTANGKKGLRQEKEPPRKKSQILLGKRVETRGTNKTIKDHLKKSKKRWKRFPGGENPRRPQMWKTNPRKRRQGTGGFIEKTKCGFCSGKREGGGTPCLPKRAAQSRTGNGARGGIYRTPNEKAQIKKSPKKRDPPKGKNREHLEELQCARGGENKDHSKGSATKGKDVRQNWTTRGNNRPPHSIGNHLRGN